MQNAECRIAECRMQNAKCRMQNAKLLIKSGCFSETQDSPCHSERSEESQTISLNNISYIRIYCVGYFIAIVLDSSQAQNDTYLLKSAILHSAFCILHSALKITIT
jgi:hypothetical protein